MFVGPTDKELILKPLREIVKATLANTPGLSSTNTLDASEPSVESVG